MKKYYIFLLILSIGVMLSCNESKMIPQNVSYLYEKDMLPYIPEYSIYHKNDSISVIYFKINTANLLYIKPVDAEQFAAKCSLKAELYDNYEMKVLIDSSVIHLNDNDRQNNKEILESLDIKTKGTGTYLLKLIFADQNKHTTVESYINIYRNGMGTRQNFMILNKDSVSGFETYMAKEEKFRICYRNKNIEKLFVRYYDRLFPIAAPPYVVTNEKTFEFTPDSLFSVPLVNGVTSLLSMHKKGIYHFQSDTASKDGFSVFIFDDGFPLVTTASQMFYPLKYITSKYEFEDMMVIKNKKNAVDKFWLENGGNADRARELIRMYYNRVQEANRYFSSYIEGWKTEKGIIYIIYGPPNVVYKGKEAENWIYGEDKNLLSISFTFYKIENPFTDNDYSLSRSMAYKDGWFLAVDNWRR